MLRRLFRNMKAQRSSTQALIVPGTLIIGLVCLLRLSSLLQAQEWMALDTVSRYCPAQNHPARITLVTVDEQDYQTTGFPISADVLAKALTNIQTYQPRVIGLDIFRDLPQDNRQDMLRKILATTPNVIAAEVALSDEPQMLVNAPEGTPAQQVGFADTVVDSDGKLRRIVLSAEHKQHTGNKQRTQKESFSLLLAKQYLAAENIDLETTALPKFHANSGGYIRADTGDASNQTQMLINFCMLQQPYETISLREVLAGSVAASKLRDRVVLIGKTATHAKDSFITSAVSQTLYSQTLSETPYPTKIIYGVEIHSHAIEQIIGTALGMKCALYTWTEAGEYLWIIAWGLLGMTTSVCLRSPWKSILVLVAIALLLTLISYYLLTQNIWTPVVPSALALCSAGLITAFFDREMRFELTQRRATIERTYEAMHSGPLQRLADISRGVDTALSPSNQQLQGQLAALNDEMRNIFARMHQDTIGKRYSLYLDETTLLDLQTPLSDLLYQVYEHSIQQPLPGFESIQSYVTPTFEILEANSKRKQFSIAAKRGLCLFLQEALLNVGNHAIGATRLDVVCLAKSNTYQLQIIDNGVGVETHRISRQGTRQAKAIAQQLGGKFRRHINRDLTQNGNAKTAYTKGTRCEIIWPK